MILFNYSILFIYINLSTSGQSCLAVGWSQSHWSIMNSRCCLAAAWKNQDWRRGQYILSHRQLFHFLQWFHVSSPRKWNKWKWQIRGSGHFSRYSWSELAIGSNYFVGGKEGLGLLIVIPRSWRNTFYGISTFNLIFPVVSTYRQLVHFLQLLHGFNPGIQFTPKMASGLVAESSGS